MNTRLLLVTLSLAAAWLPVEAASAATAKPVHYSAMLVANSFGGATSYHGVGAMNSKGTVVGGAFTHAGVQRPFIWRPGYAMRDLGTLTGDTAGSALSVNDAGQVVGESAGISGSHAVLWQGRILVSLGTLPGYSSSVARSINNKGQVVGEAAQQGGDPYTRPSAAFLWEHGKMANIGCPAGYSNAHAISINDSGQIVGWALSRDGATTAIMWDRGKIVDLGQRTHRTISEATAINNRGEAVGDSGNALTDMRATVWLPSGKTLRLAALPYSNYGRATGVNNNGLVVGVVQNGHDEMPLFTWDKQAGMRGVISLLPPSSGWFPLNAFAVSDDGRILAWGDYLNESEQICVLTPHYSYLSAHLPGDNLLESTANFDQWRLPTRGTVASLSEDSGAVKATISAIDGTDWHVSCMQRNVNLRENKRYILTFRARASVARIFRVTAVLEEADYHNLGLDSTLTLSPRWQTFKLDFVAHGTLPNLSCIPNFMLGQAIGQVWIDGVSLRETKP